MATYITDFLNDDLVSALEKHVPDNWDIDSTYDDGNSWDTGEGKALQITINIGSRNAEPTDSNKLRAAELLGKSVGMFKIE
jgi:hypothetical protein